ncbi:hypothetical protein PMIN02_000109 [Paraphaeosphaeria minitans]
MPVRAYYLWRFTVAQLSPGSTYAPPICRKSGIVQSGTPGSHGTPMSRRETASRIQYGKILLKIAHKHCVQFKSDLDGHGSVRIMESLGRSRTRCDSINQ